MERRDFPEMEGELINFSLARLALPSWVMPGTIAQNAYFLHGKVREIAICCFESSACLNYGPADLPAELVRLKFSWHVHLPLDLPWERGPEEAAALCLALREKFLFLRPACFILHPPAHCSDPRHILELFSKIWHAKKGGTLYLENTANYNARLLDPDFLENSSFAFCLDTGHALSYGQEDLLASSLPEQAGLVHWNVTHKGGRHQSLARLSETDIALFKNVAQRLSPQILHVLEIFNWIEIMESLPVLNKILKSARTCHPPENQQFTILEPSA